MIVNENGSVVPINVRVKKEDARMIPKLFLEARARVACPETWEMKSIKRKFTTVFSI
jgi:hypothetical protein